MDNNFQFLILAYFDRIDFALVIPLLSTCNDQN